MSKQPGERQARRERAERRQCIVRPGQDERLGEDEEPEQRFRRVYLSVYSIEQYNLTPR